MREIASFEEVVAQFITAVTDVAKAGGGFATHQEVAERLWHRLQQLPEAERDRLHQRVWSDMLEGFVKAQLGDVVREVLPS
ncbi:MAG: hypothetical protein M5U32_18345 [Myxococcota bacterium]|nr:hypothetical protein [Myxococcota bacterium]